MASVNKVIVLGNLGARPEVRYTSNGVAVANISVATTRSWKKQDGQKAEETEWHRIIFYGRLAEVVGEYLDKGSSVYVEGRLRTRSWDDNGTTRYVTEVIADNMQMLGSANSQEQVDSKASPNKGAQNEYAKQSGSSARPTQSQQMKQQPSKQSQQNFDDMDDDIPF